MSESAKLPDITATSDQIPSRAEMRDKIMALENVMLAMPEHLVEIETKHHFAPGVYMREIFIPKGITLTGKIHKTEHLNILSQGHLKVLTEDGVKEVSASTVILSQPGIKRAAFAIDDSVWITVHPNPTDERDVVKLEDSLTANSFAELESFMEQKQIGRDPACHSS